MTDSAARLISFVFHPLFYFPYALIVLFLTLDFPQFDTKGFLFLWLVTVMIAVILPASFTKYITTDILLNERKDRFIPLLFTALIYLILYYLLKQLYFYDFIYDFLLSIVVVLIVLFFFNFKWKISIHSTAMGILLAFFILLYKSYPDIYFCYLLFVIFIAGLVGSARLKIKAHSDFELYTGYVLGYTVAIFVSW